MSYRNSDRSVDPTGIVLFFVILVLLVLYVIFTVYTAIRTASFDRSFNKGDVNITASYIPLGEKGSPFASRLPEWIPSGGETLEKSPRLFEVSGCEGIDLPEDATGVYASTSFFQPELISVDVPEQTSGKLNVCVPEGTQIDVVLWAK